MPAITADTPDKDGFTGTIPDFLDWVEGRLVYGSVRISEPFVSDRPWPKTVRRVEMVTAGYSDDEDLLGRIHLGKGDALSFFGLMFWESTHKGGLYVYEVPVAKYDSEKETTWLRPATDQFESAARARTLVVKTSEDDEFSVEFPEGMALSFAEPDREINDPAGVLTVHPYEPLVADDFALTSNSRKSR